jgi:chromosomal replication initiation ATPase DnaA
MNSATLPKPWLETLDAPALRITPAEDPLIRVHSRSFVVDTALEQQIRAAHEHLAQLKELARLERKAAALERRLCLDIDAALRSQLLMILAGVARHYGLSEGHLKSRHKTAAIVWPRQIYFFLARRLTRASQAQIGRIVRRDHGTALHGIRTITNRVETDPTVRAEVAAVESAIRKEFSTTDGHG